MPDISRPVASHDAVLGSALQPRRFGIVMVTLRRLAWPILRAWLLPLSDKLNDLTSHSEAQSAAIAALHEELAAARTDIVNLHTRLHDLSDRIAIEGDRNRSEFAKFRSEDLATSAADNNGIENIRREITAISNVVAHYRTLMDMSIKSKES